MNKCQKICFQLALICYLILGIYLYHGTTYASEITVTWDQEVPPYPDAFDLRINGDNSTIINIPDGTTRIWTNNVELIEGQNTFEMRAIAYNQVSLWSDPAYYVENTLLFQSNWNLHYADSEESIKESGAATNAFDGNTSTFWHTEWSASSPTHPHEIQIDLGEVYDINGFRYLPRQDGKNGRIAQYEFYISTNGSDWNNPVAADTFVDGASEKKITFSSVTGQFVRFRALSEINGNPWTSVAELNITGKPVISPAKPNTLVITVQ